jgi:glycopeptide antibiotics resistance protein
MVTYVMIYVCFEANPLLKFIGYICVVVALTLFCSGNSVKITISMHICRNQVKIICTCVGGVLSISLFWRHSLYSFIEFL